VEEPVSRMLLPSALGASEGSFSTRIQEVNELRPIEEQQLCIDCKDDLSACSQSVVLSVKQAMPCE